MNNVLRGLIQKGFVLVYMDDILVFSRTPEEHADHLREVLTVLSKNKFYANKKKCQFFQHELTFLGHVVSAEGLKVDPQKTRVVQEWPTPKNVHDVRSFLGLANYFRRFVQGYSNLVRPLTNLTRKSTRWQWSDECQRAFNDLKERLTTASVLALPDPEKPYEVITDASGFGSCPHARGQANCFRGPQAVRCRNQICSAGMHGQHSCFECVALLSGGGEVHCRDRSPPEHIPVVSTEVVTEAGQMVRGFVAVRF